MAKKTVNLADGTADQDAATYGQLRKHQDLKVVQNMAGLPSPTDPDPTKRPITGHSYLVLKDPFGQPLNRLLTWNSAQDTTAGVLEVDVIEPAADKAVITAQAGTADGGVQFDITGGTGAGALLTLTANADGSISGTIDTPGTGYRVGDRVTYPAGSLAWGAAMTGDTVVVVTKINAPQQLGGWNAVGIVDWVRALRTDPQVTQGAQKGDLQLLSELDHESIQVWDGSAWVTIYSTENVDQRIAALSLFEGTVKQVGGTAVPGAIDIDALPDLTDTTSANVALVLSNVSHYWTWVGQAGYVIKAGDANGVGADLTGAVMQVGDWLQLANRGGDGSGTGLNGAAPDFHWVHIGGDLLAKSRADVLYSLRPFVAGNYESGSLVASNGAIYRATKGVVPADPVPGATGAPWVKVPLNIQEAGDFQLLDNPAGTGKLALKDGDQLTWKTDHFEPMAGAKPASKSFYVQADPSGFNVGTSLCWFLTGFTATQKRSANYIVQVTDVTGNLNSPDAHYIFSVTYTDTSRPRIVRMQLMSSSVGSTIRGRRAVFTRGLAGTDNVGCYITPSSNGSLNGSKWQIVVHGHPDEIEYVTPGDGKVVPAETSYSQEQNRSFPMGLDYPAGAMRPRWFRATSAPQSDISENDIWIDTSHHNDLYVNFSTSEIPSWQLVSGTASGAVSALSGLDDVDLSGLADGNVIKYSQSDKKWKPGAGLQFQAITQAAYNALATKDPNVLYLVS